MQFRNIAIIIALLSNPVLSFADNKSGGPFLPDARQFILIDDINREAEAWATCSAAWDIMATLEERNSTAQAEEFSNLSNGAKLAVGISLVADLAMADDVNKDRFNATWEFAKTAMESMPEVQTTSILANLERRGMESWMPDFLAAVTVCSENLESQQLYVDMWRGLATSGLLKFK